MVLTVISMAGLTGLVNPVNAAAQAGDLIKMDGLSSVYYLGNDGKRYVFPSESVYFSWFNDFSGVVTIPSSELQSYPLGANVTLRPGTKLVKITTDPKVYAVSPNGSLHWLQSEADAKALYGDAWASKVIDVSDAFFTNYTIGSPLASGTYPAGTLLKNEGNASIYYFDGTNYRQIASESAFNANRFNFDNVVTTATPITASGTAITGMEDFSKPTGATTGTVVTGSGVTVGLASDTPATQTLPGGVSRVELLKFNLTASNDGDAIINSVTITRSGLGDKTDYPNLWIEKDGSRITAQKSINNDNESLLTFSPVLTIAAGKTLSLSVFGSVKSSSLGANNVLSITKASDLNASGGSVSGSFPISGNLMSFTTNYTVSPVTLTTTGGDNAYTVGDEDVVVGSFTLSAATRDLFFEKITLKQTGNADLSQVLGDLYLEKSGAKVSESTYVDGKYVTFVMANDSLMLEKSDNVTFKVKASIIDRDNSNNTVIFKLNNKEDLVMSEVTTGYSAGVTATATLNKYTLNAGDITISKATNSPSAKSYTKNTKGVTALIATIKANQAFTADGMKLELVTPATAGSFDNVRLYVNGVLVDSMDPVDTVSPLVFDSSVSINKGNNEIKVITDIKNAANNGDNITFKLDSGTAFNTPVFTNDDPATINGSATAAKISVATAGITATRSDGFSGNRSIVKGALDVVIGRFTLKAINDDITVNSVVLAANNSGGTKLTDAHISDIKVMVSDSQVGGTRNFSSGATINLGSDSIVIKQDTTKVVTILGSFDSSSETGRKFLAPVSFPSQDSSGKDITLTPQVDSVEFVIAASGTLTSAVDGDTPVSALLAANKNNNEVAKFKLTATDDILKINKIYLSNVKGTIADNRISAVNLYNGATLLGTSVMSNGEVSYDLSSNPLTINTNDNAVLSVRIDLNNIEDKNQTNKDVAFVVTGIEAESFTGTALEKANNALASDDDAAFTTVAATNSAALNTTEQTILSNPTTGISVGEVILIGDEQMLVNTVVTNTSFTVTRGVNGTTATTHVMSSPIKAMSSLAANSFRIRKTVPTVALQTLPATKLVAGNNTVMKFTVSADANEDVTVQSFSTKVSASVNTVQISTTGSLKVNGSTYAGSTVAADKDNTTGNAATKIDVTLTSPVVVAAGTSKTFEVVVDVTTLTGTDNNFVTSIVEDGSFNTTGNFVWSDNADVTDYTQTLANGYLVSGLSTDTQTISN